MDKRYQVFISSTFTDLQDERRKVIETLTHMDCIPAGMELFPAANEEQFEFIKKVIDDCDYYILIIGGRYGSTTLEGISFTEKEFDYAISKNIPTLVFIHGDVDNIPSGKIELDPDKRNKLELFRQKASTGRLIKFWSNIDELVGIVTLSLIKTIKMNPRDGWVRGGYSNNIELLEQINALRKEKDELLNKILKLNIQIEEHNTSGAGLSQGDDLFKLRAKYSVYNGQRSGYRYGTWENELSWNQIFSLFGPHLFEAKNYINAKKHFEDALKERDDLKVSSFSIEDNIFQTIKLQLYSLKLINVFTSKAVNGGYIEFIQITDFGKRKLVDIKCIKKETEISTIS